MMLLNSKASLGDLKLKQTILVFVKKSCLQTFKKQRNFKMKLRILIFLIVLTCSVGLASAQNQSNWNKDERELTMLIKQMTDAQVNYDSSALDKIFAADYIEISPAGEFDPREKVLGFYTPEAKAKNGGVRPKIEADEFSIRIYEKQNFAILITRLSFLMPAPEGQTPRPPMSMRATIVFRKEKGAWKIASTQYTGIRPAPQKQPAKSE